jgi:hypothetical protein
MQSLLDIVDTRLAKAGTAPVVPGRISRVVSLLAISAALAVGQLSVAIAGLLSFIRPAPQLAAACGVSAITAAALTWRDHALWSGVAPPAWVALTLFLCGATLLVVAIVNRTEPAPRMTPKLVMLLAMCAALVWVAVALRGMGPLELHRGAVEWPGLAVMTLGLAGAFALAQSTRTRRAAVPVALAGAFALFLGSEAFVDAFVNDPFVSPAPAISVTTLTAPAVTQFSVEFDVSSMWISRTGLFVALEEDADEEHPTIHAGRMGGPLAEFEADEAAFLDESRLLLLRHQRRASDLRVVDLSDNARETWAVHVPLSWPALSIDRVSERWRLLGWDTSEGFGSAEGQVGDSRIFERHWKFPVDESDGGEALTASNGLAVVMDSHLVPGFWIPWSRWTSLLQLNPRAQTRFWTLDDAGRTEMAASRTDVDCRGSVNVDQPAICSAFDGSRTRFYAVSAAAGGERLTPLATAPGRIYVRDASDRGWIVGWWEYTPVALAPALREAIRVVPSDGERPFHLAVGETVIASVSPRGDRSTIRVYSMPSHLSAP